MSSLWPSSARARCQGATELGFSKPRFALPPELGTELHLEKDKLPELTFLEVQEEPEKISRVCKEKYCKKSFPSLNHEPGCLLVGMLTDLPRN